MVQAEGQKQAQAAMDLHMTERNSTSNLNKQTGGFGLYGNGSSILPNGPAWLGQ
jgi:hypothetical protein